MKSGLMLFLLAPMLFLRAPLAHADYEPAAQFKGYVAINQLLNERLAREGQTLSLGSYLDDNYNPEVSDLLDLLGTYKGDGVDSDFQNGEANVANLVLWHVAFSGLSKDVASLCAPGGPSGDLVKIIRDDFMTALKPVCVWPQASAQADDSMMGLWLALMSFDAPMSEFEAWRDFFRSPTFAGADAQTTVAAMVLTAFDNPNFLLRK